MRIWFGFGFIFAHLWSQAQPTPALSKCEPGILAQAFAPTTTFSPLKMQQKWISQKYIQEKFFSIPDKVTQLESSREHDHKVLVF